MNDGKRNRNESKKQINENKKQGTNIKDNYTGKNIDYDMPPKALMPSLPLLLQL